MEAQRGAKAALGDAVAPRSRDALYQATQAQAPQIVRRATRLSSGGLVAQQRCDPRAQLAVVEAQPQQAEGDQGGQQGLHAGVAETQRRRALPDALAGPVELLETRGSERGVVAEAFNAQQTSVGL